MVERSGHENSKKGFAVSFAVVWVAGIGATVMGIFLLVTGTLHNLGWPNWLVSLSMFVGIWQWIWVTPLLGYARRNNRLGMHRGLSIGAVAFTFVQLAVIAALYFTFRHLTFQ